MTVFDAVRTVDGTFHCGASEGSIELKSACGADLLSDVMAFVKDSGLLLTGLVNIQVIRTAELLDLKAIIFVRGKQPTPEMIRMADEAGIPLASTKLSMFLSCGRLFEAGLREGGTRPI
jgi:predicted transcriptional regulator